MNKQVKAHLTGLNNLLEDEDDFIVIIKIKRITNPTHMKKMKTEDGNKIIILTFYVKRV